MNYTWKCYVMLLRKVTARYFWVIYFQFGNRISFLCCHCINCCNLCSMIWFSGNNSRLNRIQCIISDGCCTNLTFRWLQILDDVVGIRVYNITIDHNRIVSVLTGKVIIYVSWHQCLMKGPPWFIGKILLSTRVYTVWTLLSTLLESEKVNKQRDWSYYAINYLQ